MRFDLLFRPPIKPKNWFLIGGFVFFLVSACRQVETVTGQYLQSPAILELSQIPPKGDSDFRNDEKLNFRMNGMSAGLGVIYAPTEIRVHKIDRSYYILSGSLKVFFSNEGHVDLQTGSALLLPRNTPYRLEPVGKGGTRVLIHESD